MYEKERNSNVIWMHAATIVAQSSSCTRSKVGCIVEDGGFVSSGYNEIHQEKRARGPVLLCGKGDCPRGTRSLAEQPPGGDYSDCFAMHAEVAAMRIFMMHKTVTDKTYVYINREPCDDCWAFLLGCGVSRENVFWSK